MTPESPAQHVLIVEDEYFIANDLAIALQALGVEVVGPVADVDAATALIDSVKIDSAVLDVNLQGDVVYGIASKLRARGVPFCFATGYDRSVLPSEFDDVPRWEKPFDVTKLAAAAAAMRPVRN